MRESIRKYKCKHDLRRPHRVELDPQSKPLMHSVQWHGYQIDSAHCTYSMVHHSSQRIMLQFPVLNLTEECPCLVRIKLVEKLASVLSQPCGELSILGEVIVLANACYLQGRWPR